MKDKDTQIKSLFDALYIHYGFDFRDYYYESAHRRVAQYARVNNYPSIEKLTAEVIRERSIADRLIRELSINVTEMFRDPDFFLELRQQILPLLSQHEHLKIWHPGCSTGEEVYSLAILLKENKMYENSLLYGTDFNKAVLEKAKSGIFPMQKMRNNIKNYQESGGIRPFSDYYHSNYGAVIMDPSLKNNLVFSRLDLVCDDYLTDIHLISCRNVLIYFNKALQEKIFLQFYQSLSVGGILCLGTHETIKFTAASELFEQISDRHRIFRKKS